MPKAFRKQALLKSPFWRELPQQSALKFSLGSQLEGQLPQFPHTRSIPLVQKKTSSAAHTDGRLHPDPDLLGVLRRISR
jgi:hypothetical protein